MAERQQTVRKNLTMRYIESLPHPEQGKDVWYWDERVKELALRVRHGSKVFVVRKWQVNRLATVTIGKFPAVTIEQARDQALVVLAEITTGKDPNAQKRERRAKTKTLADVLDDYLQGRKLKGETARDYRQIINRCFGDWLDKPLTSITKDMIEQRHKKLSNSNSKRGKGEAQANLAMRVLRSLFNYAASKYETADGRSFITENPVRRLSQVKAWNRIARRQTVIRSDQLKPWFRAVMSLNSDTFRQTVRDYLLVCLFTGLRRNEAAALKWRAVDLKNKTILIVDTKNHEPHMLPVPQFLYSLLMKRWQSRENEYVFPGTKLSDGCLIGHIIEPKHAIADVIKSSGVEFSIHDLRRTFLTIAESLDIPHYALKKLANHKTNSDVTAGYIVSEVERLRQPMDMIEQRILQLVNLENSAPASVSIADDLKSAADG